MNAPPAPRHHDTRALITGGTQGLGLAVARRLAREGAAGIVISGRREALGEAAEAGDAEAAGTGKTQSAHAQAPVTRQSTATSAGAGMVARIGPERGA